MIANINLPLRKEQKIVRFKKDNKKLRVTNESFRSVETLRKHLLSTRRNRIVRNAATKQKMYTHCQTYLVTILRTITMNLRHFYYCKLYQLFDSLFPLSFSFLVTIKACIIFFYEDISSGSRQSRTFLITVCIKEDNDKLHVSVIFSESSCLTMPLCI